MYVMRLRRSHVHRWFFWFSVGGLLAFVTLGAVSALHPHTSPMHRIKIWESCRRAKLRYYARDYSAGVYCEVVTPTWINGISNTKIAVHQSHISYEGLTVGKGDRTVWTLALRLNLFDATIAAAIYPMASIAFLLVRMYRNRVPEGCCRTCRYDLTGNVSGVCPECGTCLASAARHAYHNNQSATSDSATGADRIQTWI